MDDQAEGWPSHFDVITLYQKQHKHFTLLLVILSKLQHFTRILTHKVEAALLRDTS